MENPFSSEIKWLSMEMWGMRVCVGGVFWRRGEERNREMEKERKREREKERNGEREKWRKREMEKERKREMEKERKRSKARFVTADL